MFKVSSVYDVCGGMSLEYTLNAETWKHMVSSKHYVQKRLGNRVMWTPTPRAPKRRKTKKILVVKGAYVDGRYIENVYMAV